MDEQNREFQIGLMTLVAVAAIGIMVAKFGEPFSRWQKGTHIGIVLPSAAGIYPDAPIRLSGLVIGSVDSLHLVAEGRGVLVQATIHDGFEFRDDSIAVVSRTLLGDGAIDILPGREGAPISEGARIAGRNSSDPTEAITHVEQQVTTALASFEVTGREWGRLAGNLNRMLESAGPDGVSNLQQSAQALQQFTRTMKTAEETLAAAGTVIGDPETQRQVQATLAALPQMLNETRTTLLAVNRMAQHVETAVGNLNTMSAPFARNSESIAERLNGSLTNIESLTGELAQLSQAMNDNEGTVKKLLTDPTVYRNLTSTSSALTTLLQNLKPVIADLQVFSDRIARHPEILGLRGVVRGSSGYKDSDVEPAGFSR
ncbi:MAG: MlaD family protein [Planctomycetaceae bacterium]